MKIVNNIMNEDECVVVLSFFVVRERVHCLLFIISIRSNEREEREMLDPL